MESSGDVEPVSRVLFEKASDRDSFGQFGQLELPKGSLTAAIMTGTPTFELPSRCGKVTLGAGWRSHGTIMLVVLWISAEAMAAGMREIAVAWAEAVVKSIKELSAKAMRPAATGLLQIMLCEKNELDLKVLYKVETRYAVPG